MSAATDPVGREMAFIVRAKANLVIAQGLDPENRAILAALESLEEAQAQLLRAW